MAVSPSRMSSPAQVLVLLLQEVALARVAVDDVRERLAEALFVHAALDGRDAVGEGVDRLVVARVPLERDFDLLVGLGLIEGADLAEQRLLRVVEVSHVVDDAAGVLVGLLGLTTRSLVDEADLEVRVEERHDLQALDHRLGAEIDFVEDRSGRA